MVALLVRMQFYPSRHVGRHRRRDLGRQQTGVQRQVDDASVGFLNRDSQFMGYPLHQLGLNHAVDGRSKLRKRPNTVQRRNTIQSQMAGQGCCHIAVVGDAGQQQHGALPGGRPCSIDRAETGRIIGIELSGQFPFHFAQVLGEFHSPGQYALFGGGQQRHPAHLPHVEGHRVVDELHIVNIALRFVPVPLPFRNGNIITTIANGRDGVSSNSHNHPSPSRSCWSLGGWR